MEKARSSDERTATRTTSEPRRFEPNLQTRARDDQRRDQAHPRVHALPAQRQGDESRVGKHAISSPGAPKAIGPYSPAIRAGQLLFVSGQVPIDPATGNMVAGDIADQTRRVLDNIGELLLAAGRSFGDVVRTTCLPRRHERLRGDERGVRRVLRGALSRPAPPCRSRGSPRTRASRST